jgi:hypothetical protein
VRRAAQVLVEHLELHVVARDAREPVARLQLRKLLGKGAEAPLGANEVADLCGEAGASPLHLQPRPAERGEHRLHLGIRRRGPERLIYVVEGVAEVPVGGVDEAQRHGSP